VAAGAPFEPQPWTTNAIASSHLDTCPRYHAPP
jgi:hypothetical protein